MATSVLVGVGFACAYSRLVMRCPAANVIGRREADSAPAIGTTVDGATTRGKHRAIEQERQMASGRCTSVAWSVTTTAGTDCGRQ
jgi:hypothetical protein